MVRMVKENSHMTKRYRQHLKQHAVLFNRLLGAVGIGVICLIVVSCSNMPPLQSLELQRSSMKVTPTTLSPGDNIEIKFAYWPELNDKQLIRPDGKINLQLVDDVQAAGLTPEQLDDRLTALYDGQIKDPVITVIMRTIPKIFVGGEVKTPKTINLEGRMTVLEAIIAAGGFNRRHADTSNVLLVQHTDDRRYVSSHNMKKILKEHEGNVNSYLLSANDVVYVPRTRISKINQWVDQHLNNLLPDDFTYTITKFSLNHNSTIGYAPNFNSSN